MISDCYWHYLQNVKNYTEDKIDTTFLPTWKRKLTQHIQDLNKEKEKQEIFANGPTNPPIEDF